MGLYEVTAVEPRLTGVLRVRDLVGDLEGVECTDLDESGVGVREHDRVDVTVSTESVLQVHPGLCASERAAVALVVQERLHNGVDVLSAGVVLAVGSLDADPLAEHVPGPDGETTLDQRVSDLHDPAELGGPASALGGHVPLGVSVELFPADVLLVEPLHAVSGFLQTELSRTELSLESLVLS